MLHSRSSIEHYGDERAGRTPHRWNRPAAYALAPSSLRLSRPRSPRGDARTMALRGPCLAAPNRPHGQPRSDIRSSAKSRVCRDDRRPSQLRRVMGVRPAIRRAGCGRSGCHRVLHTDDCAIAGSRRLWHRHAGGRLPVPKCGGPGEAPQLAHARRHRNLRRGILGLAIPGVDLRRVAMAERVVTRRRRHSGIRTGGRGSHTIGRTATLTFLEPNLSLTVVGWDRKTVLIDIGLDLEFAPPWQPRRAAGNPYCVRCDVDRAQLLQAAEDWEAEIAPYPDH
jgi:hypothetical protein